MKIIILLVLVMSIIVSTVYAKGISKMMEEHPDYDGSDMFDEDK